MSKQLHKNFTDGQVKSLLKSYLDKKIKLDYILQMLRIKRRRFFELIAKYRKDPDSFSIQYERKTINRKINPDIEKNIVKELKIEKDLIKNKDIPIKWYNYSYIKDLLEQKYSQKVSLPTIIDRAKRNNFYFLRPKRKVHDREVITILSTALYKEETATGETIISLPMRLNHNGNRYLIGNGFFKYFASYILGYFKDHIF
jgi:hypothetical protein